MSFPHQVAQTFMENWPEGVRKLAPRSASLELSLPDVVGLGSYSRHFRAQMSVASGLPLSEELTDKIAAALGAFPGGVMPRIGYCSWKESSLINAPARNLRDVMAIISKDDERIARALVVHAQSRESACLHLREWRRIPSSSEFRIFIKKRRFVGASQYAHSEVHEDIQSGFETVWGAITQFCLELIPQLHLDDVVADVFLEYAGESARAVLIELNPLNARTDSCLFNWRIKDDFDGGLRFRDTVGRVVGYNPCAVRPNDAN
jgi:hypothetical protein